jgi:uncharacterized protein YjdB
MRTPIIIGCAVITFTIPGCFENDGLGLFQQAPQPTGSVQIAVGPPGTELSAERLFHFDLFVGRKQYLVADVPSADILPDGSNIKWRVSDTTVARIQSEGSVLASVTVLSEGLISVTVQIDSGLVGTATRPGWRWGTARIQGHVNGTKTEIVPGNLVLYVGGSQHVNTTIPFRSLEGPDRPDRFKWRTADTTIAKAERTERDFALVTAIAPGRTTLAVYSDSGRFNGFWGITNLEVRPVPALTITPASAALAVGDTIRFSCLVNDGGTPLALPLQWSSSNSQVFTVTDGLVRAVAAGTATVRCTVEPVPNLVLHTEATVNVGTPSAPGQLIIRLDPDTVRVAQGATTTLSVGVRDANGVSITRAITMTMVDPTIASVTNNGGLGSITGLIVGSTAVQVTVAGPGGSTFLVPVIVRP